MQCLICHNQAEPEVIHNDYSYYRCIKCKTSQLLPQPSDQDLAEYYNEFHLSGKEGGVYEQFEARVGADFEAKCGYIKKNVNNNGKPLKLLDVGCGKGFFVKEALNQGFQAEGIDVSKSAIEYAKEKLGLTAHNINIEELADSDVEETFDVITLWATIEHLPRPLETLKAAYRLLKKGGSLFLDTGLGNVLSERLLAGHSQWYDAPQHLFVYSQKGLSKLLEDTGFTIRKTDTNWERNKIRRYIKLLRSSYICFSTYITTRAVLGKSGFLQTKKEAKWPIGRLMSVVAVKG